MFIGKYELDDKVYANIYYKCREGYEEWFKDTFSPEAKNIEILDFTIRGNNYTEKKACLEEIAKDWQLNFSWLGWSYGELAEICEWFNKNAKRYGLLQVFKENAIC